LAVSWIRGFATQVAGRQPISSGAKVVRNCSRGVVSSPGREVSSSALGSIEDGSM
jgi:hypothetical protein